MAASNRRTTTLMTLSRRARRNLSAETRCRPLDETVGHVENAIVDDEIRIWVSAIRATGALVWVIVDTCHAGTMTRGAPH